MLKAQQTSLTPKFYTVPVAPILISNPNEQHVDPAWEAMRLEAVAAAEAIREQARNEAAQIRQEATATAESLLESERARVQSILEAEVMEAKRVGYEDGFERARLDLEASYAERFAQIEHVYQTAMEDRRTYLAESEPMIVDLACEVARKIMLRESATDRSWVLDVVREALEEINDVGKIEVRVHPEDFELVNQNREGLRKEVPGQSEILVLPDRGVQAGGCVVHTAFGNIDARIDTQLDEVRKALLEVAASIEP
ncbi:MAG: FliH/SctL family protein [Tumebacillaceae bacterium]